jgi:hypothetical protein
VCGQQARLEPGGLAVQIPGVHLETLRDPVRYTTAQLDYACAIAYMLGRGRFVLLEEPRR